MASETSWENRKYQTIKVRLDGAVAVVTLARPPRNAWNVSMNTDLIDVYTALDEDSRVKVVILTGEPNKANAFCAGADLSEGDFSSIGIAGRGGHSQEDPKDHRDTGGQTNLAVYRIRKPTIAAINGHAVGIGLTMTLPFDIRLAWKDAKCGFVFAQRGIIPEAASSFFLPRLIGHSRTLELFLRARVLPASHPSYDLLFSELLDKPEDVFPAAMAMAKEMCDKNSVLSMATIKALVWHGYPTAEQQHLLDSEAMGAHGNSPDGKEGVKSFMEKRKVDFKGQIPKDLVMKPWWTPIDVRGPHERVMDKSKL